MTIIEDMENAKKESRRQMVEWMIWNLKEDVRIFENLSDDSMYSDITNDKIRFASRIVIARGFIDHLNLLKDADYHAWKKVYSENKARCALMGMLSRKKL